MKNLNPNSNPLPVALLLGKKMNFEDPQKEKFIYDPKSQTTEVFHFGETGTGGKVGTKCSKTISTKKERPGHTHWDNKQKNEIDDSKSKDK